MGWDFSNKLDDSGPFPFSCMEIRIYDRGKFNMIQHFSIDWDRPAILFHLDVDVWAIWELNDRRNKSFIYSLWGYKIEDNADAMLEFIRCESKWYEYNGDYHRKVVELIEKLQS